MPGPIDSLRFVHAAIIAEAEAIEAAVQLCDSAAQLADLGERIAWFGELVDLHTRGEEKGLFPKLAERYPQLDQGYLLDHETERALFRELCELVEKSQAGDASARARLERQAIAVTEHARSHIHKENELILPLVTELFSPPEQGAMVQEILSTIPPEQMARAVPFIVSRVDEDTAVAYVGALSRAMPPPVFEAARGWIREGVDPGRVAALEARVEAF